MGANYTNGFDVDKVTNALFSRIGWMAQVSSPVLNPTNALSKSGRFFNDGSFHTLVSLNTVKSIMEQLNASDIEFNAFISTTQKAVILRCLNGIFSDQEYISQSLLYNRSGYSNNDQPLPNLGKFVGIQIKLPSAINLATQIDSISLYFDSVATFNIYVFNDTIATPVFTIPVTTVANTQTIIDIPNCILNYVGAANHGGIFYIGYFQDDLGLTKAIWETNVDFVDANPYRALPITAIKTGTTSFNTKFISYQITTAGINPHFSVFRDHTWQIINKPSLFDNVIGLQMAAQIIELLLFSQRQNATERGLKSDADKMQASLELTGVAPISDGPRTTGLRKQIQIELNRLQKSFYPKPKSAIVNEC